MGIDHILFVLMCLGASLISSVFGLGTALVVLALGSHILPIKEVLALATVLFATSTALKSLFYRQSINWRVAATLAVASFPFAFLGASLVPEAPAPLLRRLLGLMILLYVALSLFKRMPKFKINTPTLIAGSAAYGFISGFLGSGNIIKAVMFREMKMSGEAFVGAMAATSVLANIAKLTAFTQSGLLHAELQRPIVALILASFIAVLTGRYCLQKISASQFSAGLQMVLVFSAIALLVSG